MTELKDIACIAYRKEAISRLKLAKALGVNIAEVGSELKRLGFRDPMGADQGEQK